MFRNTCFALLVAAFSTSCSEPGDAVVSVDSGHDAGHAAGDAGHDAGHADAGKDAGAPTRDHQVVRRTCDFEPYGPDYLLVPTSTDCGPQCSTGTGCAGPDDCQKKPLGQCIGLVDEDSREIGYTFCLYPQCVTDEHCNPGHACLCVWGDPYCVRSDCSADADCPSGQACKASEFGARFCTTPNDSCVTDADCDDSLFCFYAFPGQGERWMCREQAPWGP